MNYNKKHIFIYKITNLINGKIYIGQTSRIKNWKNYFGSGVLLLKAIKKYGRKNFNKEFLFHCRNEKQAKLMEIYFIKKFNCRDRKIGYNIHKGGISGIIGNKNAVGKKSRLGKIHKEETKKQISEKIKNIWKNKLYRKKLIGRKRSFDIRKRMSESHKGVKFTDERKKKHSIAIKFWWKNKKISI